MSSVLIFHSFETMWHVTQKVKYHVRFAAYMKHLQNNFTINSTCDMISLF